MELRGSFLGYFMNQQVVSNFFNGNWELIAQSVMNK